MIKWIKDLLEPEVLNTQTPIPDRIYSETQNLKRRKTNEYEKAAARLSKLISEINKQHGH